MQVQILIHKDIAQAKRKPPKKVQTSSKTQQKAGVTSTESVQEKVWSILLAWDWIGLLGLQSGLATAAAADTLTDEGRQSAQNAFESKDFQEHYQRVVNSTNNAAANFMTDEEKRLSENYTASKEKLKSSQEQYSNAYSELNQISENLSFVESHTSSVNTNLNTEFSNWLDDRGSLSVIFDRERESELNTLRDQFIEEKCQATIGDLQHYKEPHQPSRINPILDDSWNASKSDVQQKASDLHLSYGQPHNGRESIVNQYENQASSVSRSLTTQQDTLRDNHDSIKEGFQEEHQKIGTVRLNNRIADNASHLTNSVMKSVKNLSSSNDDSQTGNPVAASTAGSSWFDYYSNPSQI